MPSVHDSFWIHWLVLVYAMSADDHVYLSVRTAVLDIFAPSNYHLTEFLPGFQGGQPVEMGFISLT